MRRVLQSHKFLKFLKHNKRPDLTSPLATTPQVKTPWQRADKSFHLHNKTGGLNPGPFFEVSGTPKWAILVSQDSLESQCLVSHMFWVGLIFGWESIHTHLSSSCLKLCLQWMDGWMNYIIQVPSKTWQGKACSMWFSYAWPSDIQLLVGHSPPIIGDIFSQPKSI
jgi:hypothetical protein